MGIKERRQREKSELRSAILTAALDLADTEGWAAVSIRKIAERIEYSPPMIYEYFDDKESLLMALTVDGFDELLIQLHAARQAATDPQEAIIAMALAYWVFAQDRPKLYQVMNGLDGVRFGDMSRHSQIQKPLELAAIVQEVQSALAVWGQANGLILGSLDDMLSMLWGMLHGLVSLNMAGRVNCSPEQIHNLIRDSILTLMRGWQSQG